MQWKCLKLVLRHLLADHTGCSQSYVISVPMHNYHQSTLLKSRLTVVSREAKEEVPCDGLSTNAREYFTRTNLAKTKNTITYEP